MGTRVMMMRRALSVGGNNNGRKDVVVDDDDNDDNDERVFDEKTTTRRSPRCSTSSFRQTPRSMSGITICLIYRAFQCGTCHCSGRSPACTES